MRTSYLKAKVVRKMLKEEGGAIKRNHQLEEGVAAVVASGTTQGTEC